MNPEEDKDRIPDIDRDDLSLVDSIVSKSA
jgi:hypothetical protein